MLAYKYVRLRQPAPAAEITLRSMYTVDDGPPWTPGTLLTAECVPTPGCLAAPHDVPHEDCTCGFYSVATYDDLVVRNIDSGEWWYPYVIAQIDVSGTVIPHEKGYRSSHATLVAMMPTPCMSCWAEDKKITWATYFREATRMPKCVKCAVALPSGQYGHVVPIADIAKQLGIRYVAFDTEESQEHADTIAAAVIRIENARLAAMRAERAANRAARKKDIREQQFLTYRETWYARMLFTFFTGRGNDMSTAKALSAFVLNQYITKRRSLRAFRTDFASQIDTILAIAEVADAAEEWEATYNRLTQ